MEPRNIVRLLPVDEALIVSPEVLAEFVKENFDKKHDTLLVDNIPDWEDVSQEKRDLLNEKLQAAIRKVITHSIDPDDLAARLAQVPSERGSSTRLMSPTASSEDEFDEEATPLEYQARCYQALLEEGGRPLFHIDLLPQISANVDKYHDLLRPWRPYPDSAGPTDWEVFHTQIRGRNFEFPEYLDRERRHEQIMGGTSKLINSPEYEQQERNSWERKYGQRKPRQYDTDDEEKAAFLGYNNAMKDLLMDYGFTWPFQLHLDLEQQDQWTTFVEYLGFECRHLRRLTRSMESMCPQSLAERDESVKAEAVASSTTSTKSLNKQVYELEGTMAATENDKEAQVQTAREEKQPEMQAGWGLPDQGRYIPQSILDKTRTASEREQRYQAEKARVIYRQYRVEWILSEITKIEAEQNSAGENASLLGTKDSERKPTSDGNMVTPIEECGRIDKEKMENRKSEGSSIAQSVKLNILAEEAVPKTEKPSTQFCMKEGDVDLESAAAISAQVSSAATVDSQETCNDRRRTLRPRSNGKVAPTASKSVEANKKQAKE
ncbi:hypothetical protein GGI43DRAFT_430217 [Trichoderma evansii]